MSGRYAEHTEVSTEKTRMDLERVLMRYGAERFAYASEPTRALVMFEANGRRIRFVIPTPRADDERFTHYRRSKWGPRIPRADNVARQLHEQAGRQVWRALLLVVKAKLEAVAAGITTFEDEFLAHTVLPDGRTFGEWAGPQIDEIGKRGMPPMLTGGGPS
jgi:hypothetical protein